MVNIARTVFEVQASIGQAGTQVFQLTDIDGIGQRDTCGNIVNHIATKADSVTRDNDVFTAFIDVDAALVDGHQVIGSIA